MDKRIFGVGLFFVLLSVFIESHPPGQGTTPRSSPTRNAEQFQADPAEIFRVFSAAQPSDQQGGLVGIPKGASTSISPMRKSVIQQTTTLNPGQIAEIEQRTRNNPGQLSAEMRFRLTPDIFGPICLEKTTPEAVSTWLMSVRPRINFWSNERIVRSLQAVVKMPMKPSGLIVDKTRGYLAAVPDGLVEDRAIVKVHISQRLPKSPRRTKTFLANELSPQKYLLYEVQGLLAITDRENCILVIVSRDIIRTFTVKRDRSFWNNKMLNKIEQFSTKIILPEPSSNRRPTKNENERESLREKARELLTCNVCSEVIKPPYKVCRNGHLLCHSCWPELQRANPHELPKCPTCRAPIPPKPSRCLPLETLCNIIDPEMSPPPVIRPDDPMDVSSRPSSPELPQSPMGEEQIGFPAFVTHFFQIRRRRAPRSRQRRLTSGEVERDSLFERPITPQSPIGRYWGSPRPLSPFAQPFSPWPRRALDTGRGSVSPVEAWSDSFSRSHRYSPDLNAVFRIETPDMWNDD